MYSFNWRTPVFDGKLMAPHALDVPFAFDTLDAVGITGYSPAAPPIAAAESSTWASFAGTGMRDNKAIPHWPPYMAADRATMMIGTEWRVQNDPQHEAWLWWTKMALVEKDSAHSAQSVTPVWSVPWLPSDGSDAPGAAAFTEESLRFLDDNRGRHDTC